MSHTRASGWRLHVHEVVGSTQDLAIAAARAGGADHLAVLAREQSAGRGSHGRHWIALRGNLNLSLVLQKGFRLARNRLWSLLAGVVLHAAVSRLSRRDGLLLKWPNDLMLDGAKLGGILVDSSVGAGGRCDWIVIGFGVNVERAPEIAGRRVACLCGAVRAEDLAAAILREIDLWRESDDEAVRRAWLERAHPLGTRLRVVSPAGERLGAFAGLSTLGGLLLEGDVHPMMSAETDLHDATLRPSSACVSAADPMPSSLASCS